MKMKLIARIKKLKKERKLSYAELSMILGFKSANTSFNYLAKKLVPKSKYEMLDKILTKQGY